MIRIELSANYIRDLKRLLQKDPDLGEAIEQRVSWFIRKSHDERLQNHALTGSMEGLHAFSITDDIRIVYKWLGSNRVRFLAIGSHDEVYGSSL